MKDREVKTVVSDKVECERWSVCDEERWCVCVTKQCVKDGVCESCVCERECVTKLCVKDGV